MGSLSPHPFYLNDRGRLPLQSGWPRGPEQEESGLKAEFCLKNLLLETRPEGVKRRFNGEQLHCDGLIGEPPHTHSVQFLKTHDFEVAVV